MSKRVSVYRKEHFNAAHRLYRPDWDDATNARVFGKCALPHFHGHNYELIVKVTGAIDAETGYVIDMKVLSDLIQAQVIERFDHRNLNLDTQEFANLNPTAEHIAIVIYDLLRPHITPAHDLQVRLYETPRNFVDYPA
jgi:6-pyruvoyltetrahydropterin/6-carboxytetrahydropterin synthase